MRRLLAFLRSGRGLPIFAALALGWMVLVILEGAIVRATGSGGGCGNHWPLCNGDVIPHHPRLATVIEFLHRSMTGVCSGLIAGVITWTFLARPAGNRARTAAVWSGVLLVTEALLGAVLVKGGFVEHNTSDTRVIVQCVHFTNTLLLLGAVTLTWWWQSPRAAFLARSRSSIRLSWFALALTVLTGATGSVAALADTLFPAPDLRTGLLADFSRSSPLLLRMRWMHPAASIGAFLTIALLAWAVKGRVGKVLMLLLAAQLVLGVADVLALAPISLQLLHLLGADLLWIALVSTASQVVAPTTESAPTQRDVNVTAALTPNRA